MRQLLPEVMSICRRLLILMIFYCDFNNDRKWFFSKFESKAFLEKIKNFIKEILSLALTRQVFKSGKCGCKKQSLQSISNSQFELEVTLQTMNETLPVFYLVNHIINIKKLIRVNEF